MIFFESRRPQTKNPITAAFPLPCFEFFSKQPTHTAPPKAIFFVLLTTDTGQTAPPPNSRSFFSPLPHPATTSEFLSLLAGNKPTAPQQPSPSLSPLAGHQTSLPFGRSFFPQLTAAVSSITAAPSVPPEHRQHAHRPDLFAPLSHQRRRPRTNRQTPSQATAATPPPHSHRPICHPKQRRRRRNP